MKLTRTITTIVLLLFVGVTVGTLIAQEVARTEPQPVTENETESPVDLAGTTTDEPVAAVAQTVPIDTPVFDEVDSTDEDGSGEPAENPAPITPAEQASCVVDVVYFHNTYRCVTCVKIESDAKAIVEDVFADELAAGTLRWSAVNMEQERAYISLYNLAMPSLVLIRKVGDEVVGWTTLSETWSLIKSTTRFSAYIIDGMEAFLGGCP